MCIVWALLLIFFFFPLVFFFPSIFFVISFWNSCEIDFGAPGFIFHISVVFLYFSSPFNFPFFFFFGFSNLCPPSHSFSLQPCLLHYSIPLLNFCDAVVFVIALRSFLYRSLSRNDARLSRGRAYDHLESL